APLPEGHGDGALLTSPLEGDLHLVAGVVVEHDAAHVAGRVDLPSVDLGDDVTDLDAAPGRGGAGDDLGDEGALVGLDAVAAEHRPGDGVEVGRRHAEEGPVGG